MARYTFYNLGLAMLVLPVCYWIASQGNRKRSLLVSARVALLVTLLLFPWDFFAIRLGVWTYPLYDGVRVYGVPINDSIFIWLCSFLACVVLITFDARHSERKRHPEGQ